MLGQLTSVGEISPEAWAARWRELRLCTDTYYVIVIEDTDLRRVVGEQYILGDKQVGLTLGLSSVVFALCLL